MEQDVVLARVFVPGHPRTKGSLKPLHVRGASGRPCKVGLTEDKATTRPWMLKIVRELIQADTRLLPIEPYFEPVVMHCFFRYARGMSVELAAADAPWPVMRDLGDEDKLRRAVNDALTKAGVIADDSLVIGGATFKRWTLAGEQAGVEFVVLPAPSLDAVLSMERALLGKPAAHKSDHGVRPRGCGRTINECRNCETQDCKPLPILDPSALSLGERDD